MLVASAANLLMENFPMEFIGLNAITKKFLFRDFERLKSRNFGLRFKIYFENCHEKL